MAVKRRREKSIHKEWLGKFAVKIRCRHCDNRAHCDHRASKEALERQNIQTRCTLTPNRRIRSWNVNSEIVTFKQYLRLRNKYNNMKGDSATYD